MPVAHYWVVDQNVLRRDDILRPAIERARRQGGRVIIPDVAFVEMTKSEEWRETVRRSLRLLSLAPELVILGRPIPELLREEKQTGRPIAEPVHDAELTGFLQQLLKDFRKQQGPALDRFWASVPSAREAMRADYLNDPRNKQRIVEFVGVWRQILGRRERSEMAQDASTQAYALARPEWSDRLRGEMISAGYSQEAARDLASPAGATYRVLLAMGCVALRWFLRGGIEGAGPELLTNDLVDADYAVTASYCAGLVTCDKDHSALHALLRNALTSPQETATNLGPK